MFASIGRRDDTSANTTRFTSTSSEMAQHDGSAGVEELPQDVTRHENVLKIKKMHIFDGPGMLKEISNKKHSNIDVHVLLIKGLFSGQIVSSIPPAADGRPSSTRLVRNEPNDKLL